MENEVIEGTTWIARCLKNQGIDIAFGIVGVPVTPLAEEMQKAGIKFIAMRNEQAASYAASVVGYLLQKPALCLTVAGPGLVHALPGLLNSTANCWPMVLMSSAAWTNQQHKGSFQEAPQIEAARVYAKYAVRVETLTEVSYHIQQSVKKSVSGRPGGVYIELARELIVGSVKFEGIIFAQPYPSPPRCIAPLEDIKKALQLLQNSVSPLVVIGRGAAYSRAEAELLQLVTTLQIPFLSSPMGKGVISDVHPLCVSAARSLALSDADVILFVGARLNWMFNFGLDPGISSNAKIIQIDISPDEFNTNRMIDVALLGDAKAVVKQLLESIDYQVTKKDSWLKKLATKCEQNTALNAKKSLDASKPMKYHFVLSTINKLLPKDAIIVNEGANTMDIGRVTLINHFPRTRLDAGTLGTMGVGIGYAIAAAVALPQRKVVAIEGDSAFGFSGFEVEVAVRYQLPITFIVLNNSGIYCGQSSLDTRDPLKLLPTSLTPDAHYERIIEAFGGRGFYVEEPLKLEETLKEALSHKDGPTLVNIVIDPHGPTPSVVASSQKSKTVVH